MESQHQYDDGLVSLEHCDRAWFSNLYRRHKQEALFDLFFIFGIFDRNTGEHFGNIDSSTIKREICQWAEIGYAIHNQYWRKGLGREAVRAALVAGFESLGYHRIEAVINVDNHASIALAESVGMQKECIRRDFSTRMNSGSSNSFMLPRLMM